MARGRDIATGDAICGRAWLRLQQRSTILLRLLIRIEP